MADDDTQALSARDWLERADHVASRDFDRAIITLSSGGLAISLVFVHDVAPHPRCTQWLVAGWSLFTVSLVLILLSFLVSMSALRREMNRIDKNEDRSKPLIRTRLTAWFNWASAVALIAGVGALLVFASRNV